MSIHPQIIEKEGKKEFVVLPYEEFLKIQEALNDFQDLQDLRAAKAEAEASPATPLHAIRDDLLSD
ncbi:type II toxin-antitoxin system Phd/YefM family antitoxin [Ruficoccus amylovorans]|uniref:Antitoxin n=1 Tax=Ruficoccus amylovorans TaxID=1804625 RepID=A0A842HI11_9BACT|nr:type II toxin-antitoxin system Phd/YefM family antitoxin [Ruficoccus amylovorans]MBC2596415.1 type II toxin-antitoxin system Phd/YefM family antitoxin [Ruficoccus amylovorans]